MSEESVGFTVGFIFGIIVIVTPLLLSDDPEQLKAVELGYAEWVVDRKGDTEFQWIIPEEYDELEKKKTSKAEEAVSKN